MTLKTYFVKSLLIFPLLLLTVLAFSQNQNDDYIRVAANRADKIVKTLDITDAGKAITVRDIIAGQYTNLNTIHTERDANVESLKKEETDKQKVQNRMASLEEEYNARINKLHQHYLANLSHELSPAQIEKVKDGMTYGVLPITYNGYLDMIPQLTEVQKKQIMDYLVEAREHAMDAGSSEKKHWWFGKYKGKINNYLSAAGYDLKKEGEAWEKRRHAAKAK